MNAPATPGIVYIMQIPMLITFASRAIACIIHYNRLIELHLLSDDDNSHHHKSFLLLNYRYPGVLFQIPQGI